MIARWEKKIGPFLDLCVSSLRRGHANLFCIVPILSDVPEGTRVADRERGPLLSFEERVNDNTSNACKQEKICNNVASCDTVLPTDSAELREMRAEYENLLLQFGQLGRKDVVDDQRMVIKLYIVQDFKRDQLCSCHLSGLEYLERGEPRAISPLQD
ncbi:hypothetical protein Tco_0971940 [Tanacetum coccineum]